MTLHLIKGVKVLGVGHITFFSTELFSKKKKKGGRVKAQMNETQC